LLKLALDPFPDGRHGIAGYPDGGAGNSVVQEITKTITITAPATAGSGAWDAHVAFLPDLRDPTYNAQQAPGGGTTTGDWVGGVWTDNGYAYAIPSVSTGNNAFPWRAPVMVSSGPAGQLTFPGDGSALAGWTVNGFDWTQFANPQCRLVGGGLEVVNSTADLYKSGSVVYYTLPCEHTFETATVLDSATGTNYPRIDTLRKSRTPPATISDVMVIPGAVKVAAEEGCYVPFRMSKGATNEISDDVYGTRVFMNGANIAQNPAMQLYGFGSVSPQVTVASFPPVPLFGHYHPIPFDLSGAYFTGLQNQSSLDVTVRLYIEVFPTQYSQQLLVLADPCACSDVRAVQLYSEIVGTLPPGVPVSMNADGSWWKGVLKTIASVAPTIGSALGSVIPGAGLIGGGVGKLAELVGGMELGEKAQKKADKKKVQKAVAKTERRMVVASPNMRVASAKKKAYMAAKTASQSGAKRKLGKARMIEVA